MHRPASLVLAVLLIYTAGFCGSSEFEATVANKNAAPGEAPKGMVWIPGGEFSMGANVGGGGSCEMPMASNDAGPIHRVRVDGFWMDATAVTNEQFEQF